MFVEQMFKMFIMSKFAYSFDHVFSSTRSLNLIYSNFKNSKNFIWVHLVFPLSRFHRYSHIFAQLKCSNFWNL